MPVVLQNIYYLFLAIDITQNDLSLKINVML